MLAAFWVANDAKSKELNADIWTIFVFWSALIFLPIYLIVRQTKVRNEDHHLNKVSFYTTRTLLNQYNSKMKILSIIGIVWFSFLFVTILFAWALPNPDYDFLLSYVFFGLLYAIIFSIISLKASIKKNKLSNKSLIKTLNDLGDLKEKGLITNEEFQQQKDFILQGK